jgi:hypothetical protein
MPKQRDHVFFLYQDYLGSPFNVFNLCVQHHIMAATRQTHFVIVVDSTGFDFVAAYLCGKRFQQYPVREKFSLSDLRITLESKFAPSAFKSTHVIPVYPPV